MGTHKMQAGRIKRIYLSSKAQPKKLIFMSINQLVVDCPFEKDESDDREKGTAHWRGY
jgi:hypothetical protein